MTKRIHTIFVLLTKFRHLIRTSDRITAWRKSFPIADLTRLTNRQFQSIRLFNPSIKYFNLKPAEIVQCISFLLPLLSRVYPPFSPRISWFIYLTKSLRSPLYGLNTRKSIARPVSCFPSLSFSSQFTLDLVIGNEKSD